MNEEELRIQLGEQINITRIIEIKPYSSLLVVCRIDAKLPGSRLEELAHRIKEVLSKLLEGHKCAVIISMENLELDFYRIDPNG